MSETKANADQIEYWNEVSGPKWVNLQEDLDAQLGPLQDGLLKIANAQTGEVVIDIGCGCGASTLALGEAVGADGNVTGLDISAPMLRHARVRAQSAGLDQVSFVEGDAQVYDFKEGSVDLVTSRFGIMFFEDFSTAFKNFHRALKPGGRIAFMCWRAPQENPWMTIPLAAASEFIEMPPPPEDPQAPGPFALADEGFVVPMMEGCGFNNVDMTRLDKKLRLGRGNEVDDAYEFNLKVGPLASALADQTEETVEKVKQAIFSELANHHGPDGVMLSFAPWLVTGDKM